MNVFCSFLSSVNVWFCWRFSFEWRWRWWFDWVRVECAFEFPRESRSEARRESSDGINRRFSRESSRLNSNESSSFRSFPNEIVRVYRNSLDSCEDKWTAAEQTVRSSTIDVRQARWARENTFPARRRTEVDRCPARRTRRRGNPRVSSAWISAADGLVFVWILIVDSVCRKSSRILELNECRAATEAESRENTMISTRFWFAVRSERDFPCSSSTRNDCPSKRLCDTERDFHRRSNNDLSRSKIVEVFERKMRNLRLGEVELWLLFEVDSTKRITGRKMRTSDGVWSDDGGFSPRKSMRIEWWTLKFLLFERAGWFSSDVWLTFDERRAAKNKKKHDDFSSVWEWIYSELLKLELVSKQKAISFVSFSNLFNGKQSIEAEKQWNPTIGSISRRWGKFFICKHEFIRRWFRFISKKLTGPILEFHVSFLNFQQNKCIFSLKTNRIYLIRSNKIRFNPILLLINLNKIFSRLTLNNHSRMPMKTNQ